MSAGRRGVLAAGTIAAVAAGLLRIGRRARVDCHEARGPLPGDEIARWPDWQSTRGITIAAPAAGVWPWIVQMGYPAFRAGWYRPYWLIGSSGVSRSGAPTTSCRCSSTSPSATRCPTSPDGSTFFTVVAVEPARALVMHSTRHLMRPFTGLSFSRAFVLATRKDGTTRLLMRARHRRPVVGEALLWLLIRPGDFLNASVMLRGIRQRVEGSTLTRA